MRHRDNREDIKMTRMQSMMSTSQTELNFVMMTDMVTFRKALHFSEQRWYTLKTIGEHMIRSTRHSLSIMKKSVM